MEDDGKFRSSVVGDLFKCVTACESNEFLDSSNFDNPICRKCSDLPLDSDANKNASNSVGTCTTCSKDGSTCETCSSGYLRTDKVECVANC